MVNCIPLNDEREHERSTDCWCHPSVSWQDDAGNILGNGPMIIHNSADQREVLERIIDDGIPDKLWGVFGE